MKAVMIASGGLDSTAMAMIYRPQCTKFTMMTFNYGQKGHRELQCARRVAERLDADHRMIDIGFMADLYGPVNQLTGSTPIKANYDRTVVVPLRNGVFLQIALVFAYAQEYDTVMLGSHADDMTPHDGDVMYPDCTPGYFSAMEQAARVGTFRTQPKVKVLSPSHLGWGKAGLILRATVFDGQLLGETWSCYDSGQLHCGQCESCINRQKAFATAEVVDPTTYATPWRAD